MKASLKSLLAAFLLTGGFALSSAPAQAALITFEGLADLEVVTNQFAAQNVTFSNATAAVSFFNGGTLNEFLFPPTSGDTVIGNDFDTDFDGFPDSTGPMEITFISYPVESVSAYFTYADFNLTGDLLTLWAFGPLDPVNPISTLTLSENIGGATLLGFSGIGPIASLYIFGGAGSYFVLDDLNVGNPFVNNGGPVVPEPSTFALLGLGMAGIFFRSRYKR